MATFALTTTPPVPDCHNTVAPAAKCLEESVLPFQRSQGTAEARSLRHIIAHPPAVLRPGSLHLLAQEIHRKRRRQAEVERGSEGREERGDRERNPHPGQIRGTYKDISVIETQGFSCVGFLCVTNEYCDQGQPVQYHRRSAPRAWEQGVSLVCLREQLRAATAAHAPLCEKQPKTGTWEEAQLCSASPRGRSVRPQSPKPARGSRNLGSKICFSVLCWCLP